MRRLLFFMLTSAFLFGPEDTRAQASGSTLHVSVDLTVGPYRAWGPANYRGDDDSSWGGDILIAVRSAPVLHGNFVAGIGAESRITSRTTTSDCLVDPVRGCVPFFPIFRMLTGHVGWQDPAGNLRVLLGPALVDSDLAPASFGGQIRIDATAKASSHLSLVAGVRATVVPNHDKNRFNILAGGLGIRIQ